MVGPYRTTSYYSINPITVNDIVIVQNKEDKVSFCIFAKHETIVYYLQNSKGELSSKSLFTKSVISLDPDTPKEQLTKLTRAFIHLIQLYGGKIEDDIF